MLRITKAISLGLIIGCFTFAAVAVMDVLPAFCQTAQPELHAVNPEFRAEPGCPVEVTTCRTDMEVDPFGRPLAARHYIDYRNVSNKQVAAVNFRIGYVGADGRIQFPYLNASHGQLLEPGGQGSQKWRGDRVPANTTGVKIRVIEVKFADGTMWQSEKLRETASPSAGGDNGGFLPLTAEGDRVPGTPVQFNNYGSDQYKTYPEKTVTGPVDFSNPAGGAGAAATPYSGGNSVPFSSTPGTGSAYGGSASTARGGAGAGSYGSASGGAGAPSAVPGASSAYGSGASPVTPPAGAGLDDAGFGTPAPAASAPTNSSVGGSMPSVPATTPPAFAPAATSATSPSAPAVAPPAPAYTTPKSQTTLAPVTSADPISDFDALVGGSPKKSSVKPAPAPSPAAAPGGGPATSATVPSATPASAPATPPPAPAPEPVSAPAAAAPNVPATSGSAGSEPAAAARPGNSPAADNPTPVNTPAKPGSGDEFSGQ